MPSKEKITLEFVDESAVQYVFDMLRIIEYIY